MFKLKYNKLNIDLLDYFRLDIPEEEIWQPNSMAFTCQRELKVLDQALDCFSYI